MLCKSGKIFEFENFPCELHCIASWRQMNTLIIPPWISQKDILNCLLPPRQKWIVAFLTEWMCTCGRQVCPQKYKYKLGPPTFKPTEPLCCVAHALCTPRQPAQRMATDPSKHGAFPASMFPCWYAAPLAVNGPTTPIGIVLLIAIVDERWEFPGKGATYFFSVHDPSPHIGKAHTEIWLTSWRRLTWPPRIK